MSVTRASVSDPLTAIPRIERTDRRSPGIAERHLPSLPRLLASRWLLAVGFVVTQASIVLHGLGWRGAVYGDVWLYESWARGGLGDGRWPVLDFDWVYPIGALLPVTLPALLTDTLTHYEIAWTIMVVALNAAAAAVLCRHTERGILGAWWWLAFLVALGPIAIGRLDGVVAPLMVVALVAGTRHPAAATAIATAGAWIKIAPGALVVALCTTRRTADDVVRRVLVPAAVTSILVLGLALAGGAGGRTLSVVGQQGDRTLQAESVAGTWFSMARLWDPSQEVVNNTEIMSFDLTGDAARSVAGAMDMILLVAVVALAALCFRATRRRPDLATDIMLYGSLATALALIVFNKVGSPQFIGWLGPPVAVGIAASSPAVLRRWAVPAGTLIVVAALTHLLYPLSYGYFLVGTPWAVVMAALRNGALVLLLVAATRELILLARPPIAQPSTHATP